MASYGKQEYWEERYTRCVKSARVCCPECPQQRSKSHDFSSLLSIFRYSKPCEWIAGWDLMSRILTPNFLCYASAPPPSGEIRVHGLNQWSMAHLLGINNDHEDCVIDEELEYCDSQSSLVTVDFPSRDKARVLNVGCGNSHLSADMIYHGWMDITNVDYSKVVIEESKVKFVALYRPSEIGVIVD